MGELTSGRRDLAVGEDQFDLERFIAAQDADGTYLRALAEIQAGVKRSHWMWFVFPQIAGLGSSPTAVRYAISGADEARAYLAHPVLGARVREAAAAVRDLPTTDAVAVFGSVDAMKLRSSMTLFAAVTDDEVFSTVLQRWCGGPDEATLVRLRLPAGTAE